MRELAIELKQLRMHGMASAWADLVEQGGSGGGGAALDSSRWLLEHLLRAETTDRAMRSVSHQIHTAKFSVHRDLAGFDFEASKVDRKLIHTPAEMTFTDAAHNTVLVGGAGTGKTHLATVIQAVRAHQRDDHDQPGLRGMVQRVRRRQDDHGAAKPADAPLSHRGDRQRVPLLPAQQCGGQEAHQGARAG